jgi:acyl carrier protein
VVASDLEVIVSETPTLIREYLLERSDGHFSAEDLDGSVSLLEDGVIDSLGLVDLIGFIGMRFSVQLSPSEIVPANFQTIQSIAALVDAKAASAE